MFAYFLCVSHEKIAKVEFGCTHAVSDNDEIISNFFEFHWNFQFEMEMEFLKLTKNVNVNKKKPGWFELLNNFIKRNIFGQKWHFPFFPRKLQWSIHFGGTKASFAENTSKLLHFITDFKLQKLHSRN